MNTIKIKPLSVNEAWKGKRYRTDKYKRWAEHLGWLLMSNKQTAKPPVFEQMELVIVWGFSSAGSDTDNPLKPFIDVLQKFYSFNDNQIKRLVVESEKVKKGDEFIKFELNYYEKRN